MAKAEYTTSNGSKVILEGTPREVADLLKQLNSTSFASQSAAPAKREKAPKKSGGSKTTPTNLIATLVDGGFFGKPKDLASVKVALEESGHYYPITTLSPAMLRFVRKRQLRRIKEKNRWLYTGGA